MPADEITQESRALREALGRFHNRREWLQHAEGPRLAQRVEHLLSTVRRMESSGADTRDSLHVAHWNILHGVAYDDILSALQKDRYLVGADVLSLNEVDLGLARSGNRDVAFDIARALNMHAVWAPLFLELAGGHLTAEPLRHAEQREALFGLALLSRFPLGVARRIELESPHDHLFDVERKVGSFIALAVEVHAPQPFTFVVTHLDVHGAPETRHRQLRRVLDEIPEGAAIICGDLNTTTFPRGSWLRTAATLATMALSPKPMLDGRLFWPDRPRQRPREPLFTELVAHGFEYAKFNTRDASLDLRLRDTHEYQVLPRFVRALASGLFRHVERRTGHRLDWIAARGFDADPLRPPYTGSSWMRGARPASDHAPISCGLRQRDRVVSRNGIVGQDELAR